MSSTLQDNNVAVESDPELRWEPGAPSTSAELHPSPCWICPSLPGHHPSFSHPKMLHLSS